MIGLKRNTVALAAYDPMWQHEGARTVARLKEILGETALDVQHVGSTAVVGMTAKPILDIAVAVRQLSDVLPYIEALQRDGFIHRPQNDNDTQLFFACGDFEADVITHHIHVVEHGGMAWRNYINFVAYLTAFPEKASEYAACKRALCASYPYDRAAYTEGKAELIRFFLRKAMVWSYLGQRVYVEIDRPVGYVHHKARYDLHYPINYGYIPHVLGGDDEELDVYVLGLDHPVTTCEGRIVGIVHRANDVEDKLVLSADNRTYTADEIAAAVHFQEQYYQSRIECV